MNNETDNLTIVENHLINYKSKISETQFRLLTVFLSTFLNNGNKVTTKQFISLNGDSLQLVFEISKLISQNLIVKIKGSFEKEKSIIKHLTSQDKSYLDYINDKLVICCIFKDRDHIDKSLSMREIYIEVN